jgi:DNA-binding transcriptional MerR regulator
VVEPVAEQARSRADGARPSPNGAQPLNRAQPLNGAIERFKTREVVELLGLTRRQLQYWAKTGLVEPSERTPGGHHRYSFDDLVALKTTKRLLDAGVSVQRIRRSVRALQDLLPRVGRPLCELVLVATGDVVLVFRQDTVFEAISGQEWVFEVAEFQREVLAYRCEPLAANATDPSVGTRTTAANVELPAKPGLRSAKQPAQGWSQTG